MVPSHKQTHENFQLVTTVRHIFHTIDITHTVVKIMSSSNTGSQTLTKQQSRDMLDDEMQRWLDALPEDSPLLGEVDKVDGTLRMPLLAKGLKTSWTRTKIQVGLLITQHATKAKIE